MWSWYSDEVLGSDEVQAWKIFMAVEPIRGCGRIAIKFEFLWSNCGLPQMSSQGGDY